MALYHTCNWHWSHEDVGQTLGSILDWWFPSVSKSLNEMIELMKYYIINLPTSSATLGWRVGTCSSADESCSSYLPVRSRRWIRLADNPRSSGRLLQLRFGKLRTVLRWCWTCWLMFFTDATRVFQKLDSLNWFFSSSVGVLVNKWKRPARPAAMVFGQLLGRHKLRVGRELDVYTPAEIIRWTRDP